MSNLPAKENILRKIRVALAQTTPEPFEKTERADKLFIQSANELAVEFAERHIALGGKFIYVNSVQELQEKVNILIATEKWSRIYCAEQAIAKLLPSLTQDVVNLENISSCEVAVTGCECLIARTGSIVMSSQNESGRTASVYAPVHICIALYSQVVADVAEGIQLIQKKYGTEVPSLITFATGPSRTADIEKTLIVGVHGPREVYVFLLDEEG